MLRYLLKTGRPRRIVMVAHARRSLSATTSKCAGSGFSAIPLSCAAEHKALRAREVPDDTRQGGRSA